MTKWLRNKHQRERYGCTTRTLERMRKDGRLPPAQYPFGNRVPANTEAELDAHDAAVIKHGPQQRRRDGATARTQHQAAE
jgi:hypothetical protein